LCRRKQAGDLCSGLPSLSEKMEDDGMSVILLWRSSNSNVVTLEDAADAAKS
jgi:hypothetical protein